MTITAPRTALTLLLLISALSANAQVNFVNGQGPFVFTGIIGRSGSVEIRDDGSILSAATDSTNGELNIVRQLLGAELVPIVTGSDVPQFNPGFVFDLDEGLGDVGTIIGTLGFDFSGAIIELTQGLDNPPPDAEQRFADALRGAQDYFITIGCTVVDFKISDAVYSRFSPLVVPPGLDIEPPYPLDDSYMEVTVKLITVHCDSGITYRFYIDYGTLLIGAFAESEAFIAGTTPVEIASIPNPGGTTRQKGNDQPSKVNDQPSKVNDQPSLAIPPTQSVLSAGLQTVDGYIGISPDSQQALPTLVWRAEDTVAVEEFLQLSGFPTTGNSDLRLCGKPFYEHLWMSWTSATGTVQLAHVSDRKATVTDLGPGNVTNSLACDDWGNAVVAYSTLNGNTMTVEAFGPDGSSLDSASFPAAEGSTGMPISVDMNNNGEVVVAWSAQPNATYLQRLTLEGLVAVDISFDGSWNNPAFDGEGFIWDVALVDGVPTLVLYYFTYQPDGSGRQGWMVGSAPIENGVANITMAITSGATFGSAYDPDDVTLVIWGDIQVRITGCRSALMIMHSPLFGDLTYPAFKFTAPPAGLEGICADPDMNPSPASTAKGSVTVDGSFSGSFYSPARNFEGFIFDVTISNGVPTIVVYWFSYDIDGSGRQLWLVGAAPINGDSVSVPLVRTEGGQYGPNFDPANISASSFVSVTITWSDCDNATVMYSVDGGESGSFDIQRLAALPGGAGGFCGD